MSRLDNIWGFFILPIKTLFCWIPSISDNEKADCFGFALSRLMHPILILNTISTNKKIIFFPHDGAVAISFILSSRSWEIGKSSYRRRRKDEGVLCRARIAHTHSSHSYVLKKDPPPRCEHCPCILNVRHILVECNNFA